MINYSITTNYVLEFYLLRNENYKFTKDSEKYVLINYIEIINWYNLPFYKKWFTDKPIKQLKKLWLKEKK